MKKLLLPFAYDSGGNLVHIDNACKNETYKCPECKKVLSLIVSKIPEGQKYYRRNHFSHPKGSPDNHCSETFLHKLFKERAAEFIREMIAAGKDEFYFKWSCDICFCRHKGNLLKKAKFVCLEYDLGICRPDIALLDEKGEVVIVIEVVVTHKPTSEVIEYYNLKKIACLQIKVLDFDDCENVEKKLSHPDSVNICPAPICSECKHRMNLATMLFVNSKCWRCGEDMKVAMIETDGIIYDSVYFTENDVLIANDNGANIATKYSQKQNKSYWANTCKSCGAFIGQHHMHEYYSETFEKKFNIGYRCYCQVELVRQKDKERLIHPETLVCEKCNHDMHKATMVIGYDSCWNCNERMKVAMIKDPFGRRTYSPIDFTEKEIEFANANGANIKEVFWKRQRENIYANVCGNCGQYGKTFLINEYLPKEIIKELSLGFKCFNCLADEKYKQKVAKQIMEQKLEEKLFDDGIKYCLKCGGKLVPRKFNNTYFYGCEHFPKCRYTEDIDLD